MAMAGSEEKLLGSQPHAVMIRSRDLPRILATLFCIRETGRDFVRPQHASGAASQFALTPALLFLL